MTPNMKENQIKVYALNDCDWWAASSLEEAIADWKAETGLTDDELDDPHELTDAEMDRYKLIDEDNSEKKETFREALNREIAEGANFPCFFATTEY